MVILNSKKVCLRSHAADCRVSSSADRVVVAGRGRRNDQSVSLSTVFTLPKQMKVVSQKKKMHTERPRVMLDRDLCHIRSLNCLSLFRGVLAGRVFE